MSPSSDENSPHTTRHAPLQCYHPSHPNCSPRLEDSLTQVGQLGRRTIYISDPKHVLLVACSWWSLRICLGVVMPVLVPSRLTCLPFPPRWHKTCSGTLHGMMPPITSENRQKIVFKTQVVISRQSSLGSPPKMTASGLLLFGRALTIDTQTRSVEKHTIS